MNKKTLISTIASFSFAVGIGFGLARTAHAIDCCNFACVPGCTRIATDGHWVNGHCVWTGAHPCDGLPCECE